MRKVISPLIALFFLALVFAPASLAATTSSLFPTGDGFYSQFTPKSGAIHFTQVDENPCNGTTDYNSTTVVGERDSYALTLASIPNNATISQISITPCASRVNSGGANPTMNLFYRLNGVNSSDQGSYSLTGTTPSLLSATNFSGLSIIKLAATNLEVGSLLTSGAKGVRLSNISAVFTYKVATPSVTTNDATNLSTNSATLNSTVNPNGATANVYYRYGLSNVSCPSLSASSSGILVGSGTSDVSPNSKNVTGLISGSTYYFCAVAYNSTGTNYGNVLSFITP